MAGRAASACVAVSPPPACAAACAAFCRSHHGARCACASCIPAIATSTAAPAQAALISFFMRSLPV